MKKSDIFENLVMNFSIDTEELSKADEKKRKAVPARLEILAEGLAARWSLEQINQKLEENECEKLYARSFYEACLIYAFEHRMDYEEWKELFAEGRKLFEKSKGDEKSFFRGGKITLKELKEYMEAESVSEELETMFLTRSLEEKIIKSDSEEEFLSFVQENIEKFSSVRERARYYFCKYLYFYIFPVTNILPLIICASTKAFWEESNGDLLYQNIIICITFIVVAIIDFATIFVVDSIRKTDDKNAELLILSTKNEIEYQSLELIKAEREGLRHIKHDIKNIHLTVKELILSGNNEQALDILNQSNDELTEIDGLRLCGNDIINTVFYIKSKEAKAENIELNVEVDIQNSVKIKNIDLARILLNLCDNAINATKECDKKEIYFSITASDKIIKIDTKNPFINRKKVIQEGHGNGTKIIKEIAEKHGGDYKASSENGIYTTHTTLRNIEANI